MLYGVFVGTKWGMTRNRRVAIKAAREARGQVRVMEEPESVYWDMPTFYACSTLVVSFEVKKEPPTLATHGVYRSRD